MNKPLRPAWFRRKFAAWAARREPDAPAFRLRQSRVYVLPTRAGLGLVGTLALMLLASINYNLSLGYAFTFLLAGTGLAHILQSWRTLVELEIRLTPEAEVFVGEQARFRVSLHNPHTRERPGLCLVNAEGQEQACVDVAPCASSHVDFLVPAPRRGRLHPGLIIIETRQPMGWVRAWSHLNPAVEHLVYPRLEGDLPWPHEAAGGTEGEKNPAAGQDDFAGMREFRVGDSLRHVAWKSLARGRGLLTKEFEGYQSPDLCFDYAALPAGLPVEARLSQLAVWVEHARRENLRTTLILPDARLGPASDTAHHCECLRRLALFGESPTHV